MNKAILLLIFSFNFSVFSFSQRNHTFDEKPYFEGEILVQLKENTTLKDILIQLPENYEAELMYEVSKPMGIWLLKFNPDKISHEAFIRQLYTFPQISIVDYNYKVFMRETTPNDTQFTQQWHHKNTGQTGGTVDADIDSDLAWDITTGGTTATGDEIVVCVIESANLNHIDLVDNRWINTAEIPDNGIDDDGNGYIDDYFGWNVVSNNDNIGTGGHGTSCAGMIGAKGNNGIGVSGVNWDVKIMVINGYNVNSQANIISNYTYPLVMRQRWNNSNGTEGAFVVATSASWGIDNANAANYPLWCAIYDTLGKYGILNVGATTNNNSNVDNNGDMPTTCASQFMIGVGRTDHNDGTAGGFGVVNVDLGAPGINVRTTSNTNAYTTTTGTSFACPLTAGAIGLAYSIPCTEFMDIVKDDPMLGATLVLNALYDGTDVKPQFATRFATGGRLNVKNTIDLLMVNGCSSDLCLAPSNLSDGLITENTAQITWNSFSSADSYTLFFKEISATTWDSVSTTTTSFELDDLEGCTVYSYYIRSVCPDGISSVSATKTFRTKGCGNCIELAYCSAAGTNSSDEWIQSIQIGSVTETTGNNNGYGDFTGETSFTFMQKDTLQLIITPGFDGTTYNEYSRIWIDFDQNGIFATSEKVYDQTVASSAPATGQIVIPENAPIGISRMRVQMAYQGPGQTSLPQLCGNFTYGEVEDYCIEVVEYVSQASVELLNKVTFSIFPNPSTGSLSLNSNSILQGQVKVFDLNGKLVYVDQMNGKSMEIDLNSVESGVYFITLRSDDSGISFQEKIVLQK